MLGLLKRFVRPEPKLSDLKVTVYTRQDCCCCHTAIAFLEGYRRRLGFELELVDVDSDPELVAAHGLHVPVVALDGKVRFRGVVNKVLWDRMISSQQADQEDSDK